MSPFARMIYNEPTVFFLSLSPFWTAPLKRIFWITDVHAVLSYVHHTRKMTSSLPLVYMKRKPFFKISHEFLTVHNGDLMVHAKKCLLSLNPFDLQWFIWKFLFFPTPWNITLQKSYPLHWDWCNTCFIDWTFPAFSRLD